MLYPRMDWKARIWVVASLGILVVLFCWQFIIKPYEIKRLQHEAVQTALQLHVTFSSQVEHDLTTIKKIFERVERENYRVHSDVFTDVNLQFNKNHGFESIMFPSSGSKGSVVLFNPHLRQTGALTSKKQCDKHMREYPDLMKTYQHMTVIPLGGSLCMYDPLFHVFAVLNLNTTFEKHLQQEIMKGYFLVLSDTTIPELVAPNWKIAWAHHEFFQLLGTTWNIKIYPSKAYVEVRVKRVFLVFCLTLGGFLGLFIWWFLKYRWELIPLNSRYVKHLKRLALHDGLTELPNRRHCLEHLNTMLERSNRGSDHFSVCFLDCDKFKQINDEYGHHVGDLVLKHLANVVAQAIRRNDFFSRFSGDEFCLILDGTSSDEGIQAALNKVFEAASQPIYIENNKIIVSLSIGVAIYPESGQSADLLLKHADEAMYTAKHQKKNNMHAIYPLESHP